MTGVRRWLALSLVLCASLAWAEHAQIGNDKFARDQFVIDGPHAGCLGGNHLHAANLNIIRSTDSLVTYFDFNSAACGYSGTLGFPAAIAGGNFAALAGPNYVPDPPAAASVSATPATSDQQLSNVQFQGARDFFAIASGSLADEGNLGEFDRDDSRRPQSEREIEDLRNTIQEETETIETLEREGRTIDAERDRTREELDELEASEEPSEEEDRLRERLKELDDEAVKNLVDRINAENRRANAGRELSPDDRFGSESVPTGSSGFFQQSALE